MHKTRCLRCGMEEPKNIPHKTFDDCLIALVAAQDATAQTVNEIIKKEMEVIEAAISKRKEAKPKWKIL